MCTIYSHSLYDRNNYVTRDGIRRRSMYLCHLTQLSLLYGVASAVKSINSKRRRVGAGTCPHYRRVSLRA